MVDKIIGIRPDGALNSETIAAVKEIAGTGTGSVAVTDDGAGTYTVGGTTIRGLTTQGQLPAVAKKYVDDGLAGKANTAHTHPMPAAGYAFGQLMASAVLRVMASGSSFTYFNV